MQLYCLIALALVIGSVCHAAPRNLGDLDRGMEKNDEKAKSVPLLKMLLKSQKSLLDAKPMEMRAAPVAGQPTTIQLQPNNNWAWILEILRQLYGIGK